MIDWVKKNIYPPGIEKPNRLALFSVVGEVMSRVRKDAEKAFYAHFPYLADDKKLEEHGEALLIPRLQNDTPEEYRNRVATASFFLMRAGERAYIMEQLKERFGDRFLVVEEFLSIHTKVTELTDKERVWVLNLFDSLVDPNIYLGLSERYCFTEEFIITDALVIIVQKQISDNFKNGLKYNGRGKYDGHTLNLTEIINYKYNGKYKYNHVIKYTRKQTVDADSYVIVPFKYRTGIRDELTVNTPQNFIDYTRSQLKYNGVSKYNGNKYAGFFSEDSITDVLHDAVNTIFTDIETTAENLAVQIDKPLDEHFTTRNRYDGYAKHSREMKYRAARDALLVDCKGSAASETVVMDDAFSASMRFRRRFNGTYQYDGVILYNGNVPIPM